MALWPRVVLPHVRIASNQSKRGHQPLPLAALQKAYERVESQSGRSPGRSLCIQAGREARLPLEHGSVWTVHRNVCRLRTHAVPALMFADDLSLLALSVGRAQWLLDRLAEFCEAFGMRVNLSKCLLLVFAAPSVRDRRTCRVAWVKVRGISKKKSAAYHMFHGDSGFLAPRASRTAGAVARGSRSPRSPFPFTFTAFTFTAQCVLGSGLVSVPRGRSSEIPGQPDPYEVPGPLPWP
jgi:hypothetical protein